MDYIKLFAFSMMMPIILIGGIAAFFGNVVNEYTDLLRRILK